jgi:hypothetical protein
MQPAPEPARRSSALPLILGGVVAGAIGFGAATVLDLNLSGDPQPSAFAQDTRALADAQAARITALEADLSRIESMSDTSGLAADLAQITSDLDAKFTAQAAETAGVVARLEAAAADLDARLQAVEARPIQDMVSDASVEAYEAEMTKLRAAIAAHRAEIEAMATEAREAEAAARAESLKSKGAALLTDLTLAVDSGAPFAAQIALLETEGAEIPDALKATAANGVPSLSELTEAYPEAARAALSAVRQDAAGEGGQGGVIAFLQDQLGVRSVAPKDGDGPDAVLSRVEAALKQGDLTASLSGIAGLPTVAQAEMAGWAALARQRAEALAALDQLKQNFGAR